jgi:RNA polymerase sigma-70 factor (ECF subfamily)
MNPVNPDIIRKSKEGDMLAFRELVIRSTPYAYSVAFRILNDENYAKDAVQESMIKVWKKLDGFHEDNNFKTWLYRIVVHTCFDFLRKQKRNPEFRPDEKLWEKLGSSISEGRDSRLENRETAQIIRSLTNKLSPLQKAVFVMSELMQLEQEEIAEILNTNKSAVKANLYYARKGIKTMMEKHF